uniref:RRM domain-containing protein n=1 Tax=Fagus sylvatica TaxID=28930 RepID=A0A2N9HFN1_FAGSY
MAFLSKVGNLLRQTGSKQISSEFCAPKLSIYQAIRCMSSMSSSKLFIGGISYGTDEQSLREAFAKYGDVVEARIIVDRETGRSRGFGFVTYTSSEEASSAIQALDGQDLHGRRVRVNYATDRARPSYGDGNNAYGGGGGGYGNNAYGGGGGGYSNNAYGGGGGGGYGNSTYGGAASSGYGSGGYASGANYQGGGGGGDSYGSGGTESGFSGGGVGYSSGGNYASGNTGGNFDVAGGSGNIAGGVDQYGSNEGSSVNDAAGDFNQDAPLEGNYRDDDETSDFAKRA